MDTVLDFDYSTGTIYFEHADSVINFVNENKLDVEWLIETHVHADHLSAAPYIQKKLGGKLCISKEIIKVQKLFGKIYNAGTEFELDGSQFDKLLSDNDEYKLGNIASRTIATPGHTPACMAHLIGDAVFVGDTLFMPDGGTARADFPGGSAEQLYKSIQRILALPDKTRLPEANIPSSDEVIRMIAISRIMLDNIPHLKAYRMNIGDHLATVAILSGADDIDGTVGREEIMHEAGSRVRTDYNRDQMALLIESTGQIAVKRNTDYSYAMEYRTNVNNIRMELPIAEHG